MTEVGEHPEQFEFLWVFPEEVALAEAQGYTFVDPERHSAVFCSVGDILAGMDVFVHPRKDG